MAATATARSSATMPQIQMLSESTMACLFQSRARLVTPASSRSRYFPRLGPRKPPPPNPRIDAVPARAPPLDAANFCRATAVDAPVR